MTEKIADEPSSGAKEQEPENKEIPSGPDSSAAEKANTYDKKQDQQIADLEKQTIRVQRRMLPSKRRGQDQTFLTCDNPKYTYIQ